MKNIYYTLILSLLGFTIGAQSSFDKSIVGSWSKYLVEDELIPGCGLEYFYYAFEENNTKLYFTMADPQTGEANNDLYNTFADKHIMFTALFDNGSSYSLPVSKLPISDLIDTESSVPHIFEYSFNESIYSYSFTISFYDVENCDFPGELSCSNIFRLPFNLSDFNNSILINAMSGDCIPQNEQALCVLNENITAYSSDNDLVLNTTDLSTSEVISLINNSGYNSIQFIITGTNSNNGNIGNATIEFYNSNWGNFNADEWEETIEDFGTFDEYVIETVLSDGTSDFNCENPIELTLLNESETCDVLEGLYYSITDGELTFSYSNPDNPNYLEDYLNSVGITVPEAEAILDQDVNNINYILNYSNGGPYEQATYTQTNILNLNLIDLNASFSNISEDNFTGSLLIEYQNYSGESFECIIDPVDLSPESDDQLPPTNCGDDNTLPDVTNTEDIASINAGEIIHCAGLAIRVTEINTTNNLHSGKGQVSLPFTADHIEVIFNGIKINTDKNVYHGNIFGVEGDPSTYPDFAINPDTLSIGGDICLPTAMDEEIDQGGFDNATGLDANGFSRDSINSETNTPYDINGYNISGNHVDTGELWNNDGCTRDGELWAISEETGEMENTNQPCDPSQSNDPVVTEFIDSISTEIPTLVTSTVNSLLESIQDSLAVIDCGSIKSNLESILNTVSASNPNLNTAYITGENNEFINEGMSAFFSSPPKPSIFQSDQRDVNIVNLENEHVKLFECDKKKIVFSEFLKNVETSSGDELVQHIEDLIQNLTKTQVEDFTRDQSIFQDWILFQIGKYLDQQMGIVYAPLENTQNSPSEFKYSNSPYHNVADINGMSSANIETKEENNWLFNGLIF